MMAHQAKSAVSRLLQLAVAALPILVLSLVSFQFFGGERRPAPALVFDFRADTSTIVQVFFDIGEGIKEAHSTQQFIPTQGRWREVRLDLPRARIQNLRFDPASNAGTVELRNLRIVDANGTERLVLPPPTLRPVQQIASVTVRGDELQIQTTPDANDPILQVSLSAPVDLAEPRHWRIPGRLVGWILFWTGAVMAVVYAARVAQTGALARHASQWPATTVWVIATLATFLSAAPVVFQNRSFVSPNNGVVLFYDHCPTLPNYPDSQCANVNLHGSDVGAMAWSHLPLTVAQERSLKEFGEFPLWNRYNSAGTTMIGQGQLMLGDPLNWLMWLVGVDAATYDIKFILLRIIFAASLGMAVHAVTRKTLPAALVALSAPFIGYFAFRVNHPAIFTLCYAPLISLAWIKLVYAQENGARFRWLAGLMLANWVVLNSGTAKEASMALVALNAIGVSHLSVEGSRLAGNFKHWLAVLAASGICFVLIASPVWGTLIDAIRNGTSGYEKPAVYQMPLWHALGFADNYFYLLRINGYFPGVNAFLFAGFLLGIRHALNRGASGVDTRRAAMVLTCAGAVLAAIACVVPKQLLMVIPFVNNIGHVHNTFLTVLIVPVAILAGIGFASAMPEEARAQRRHALVLITVVLMTLIFFYVLSFAQAGGLQLRGFVLYAVMLLVVAVSTPWLVSRLSRGQISPTVAGAAVLILVLALGRGAMYASDTNGLAVNPQQRVSVVARPELVERLASRILSREPQRVLGLGSNLLPGYNATLGVEHINGPDAIWDRRYRELTEEMRMPFTEWAWRMLFDEKTLLSRQRELDFLGVGVVLAPEGLESRLPLKYLDGDGSLYAYAREGTWPRAFYVDRVTAYDTLQHLVEHIRTAGAQPFVAVERRDIDADPRLQALARAGSVESRPVVRARDYVLTNNSTSFTIDVPAPGVVYLGEAGAAGDFVATLNGERVSQLTANHAFKALLVPKAGTYRVAFQYWPRHLTAYLAAAVVGLVLWITILAVARKYLRASRAAEPTMKRAGQTPCTA